VAGAVDRSTNNFLFPFAMSSYRLNSSILVAETSDGKAVPIPVSLLEGAADNGAHPEFRRPLVLSLTDAGSWLISDEETPGIVEIGDAS
jgi:hypothetical protein